MTNSNPPSLSLSLHHTYNRYIYISTFSLQPHHLALVIQIKTPVHLATPLGFHHLFRLWLFVGCLWLEDMVSIRRQRLIKLYGRSPSLDLISSLENGQSPSWVQSTRHVNVLPTPSVDINRSAEEKTKSEEPESSNVNESSSSNKQPIQHPVFKRRKRHRRKHFENQEPCIMRGVYYKNMKWQAAIKVDKKQIHLGTVGSQQEAACLYDRAAFMCGREPNFELTAEEKDELSKLSWDDFLTMTRSAINSKKHQRRVSSRMKFEHPSHNSSDPHTKADQGGKSFSGSEDVETSGS
ncbi:putative transcription factor AP2-EREBP family [Helianthus annuus]|nr:putative transcription factor AP2-EREBP family [Helianthus annuus]